MSAAASIRTLVEAQLTARIPAALSVRPKVATPALPTGFAAIDQITGGIPASGVTEVVGSGSSGKTSVVQGIIAHTTRAGKLCALVDATDAFCPVSACAAGTILENLLWVRCTIKRQEKHSRARIKPLEQAFRVTDILLNTGGFSLIIVDISDVDEVLVRKVPLSSWFRFQRFVEGKPVSLVFVARQPHAGNYASMVLNVEAGESRWSASANHDPTHSRLLQELPINIVVEQKGRAVSTFARKQPRGVGQIAARSLWA